MSFYHGNYFLIFILESETSDTIFMDKILKWNFVTT